MKPWGKLADAIWIWGMVPLRAHKIETRPDPDNPRTAIRTMHADPLVGVDLDKFRHACEHIHERATRAGIDEGELAKEITSALENGARKAVAAAAKRMGRLAPDSRREYRQQAAAARRLAQFLAKEIADRPIPSVSDGAMTATYTEGDDRNPKTLGEFLRQRQWSPIVATDRGVTMAPSAFNDALKRAVETINSLHWIADLLRADAVRSRPQGAPEAPWKGTAALLRQLFEERFGEPLLGAVATLTGLAHQCDVPVAELSKPARLSKP